MDSLPPGTTPRMLLAEAQNAIANQNLPRAIELFSVLVNLGASKDPSEFNPALAVLSRASCYIQLKQYPNALKDAQTAIKLPNVKTGVELYTGCYSTRTAAAAYAADAAKAMGDKEGFMAYKRMATELMKNEAGKSEEADKLKDEGNKAFKDGQLEKALELYQKALAMDSTNTAALSNASLAFLKLGQLDMALQVRRLLFDTCMALTPKDSQMAERCVGLKPEWSKGWYRKGAALMKQSKYTEAASAFQTGLDCSPEDAELKKAYMEAVEVGKVAPSNSTKLASDPKTANEGDLNHAKKMMGMMMDLRHNSWDVKTFFSQKLKELDFAAWDDEIAPILSKKENQDFEHRVMNLLSPDSKKDVASRVNQLPIAYSKLYNSINTHIQKTSDDPSWFQYILPDHPLLSALLLFHLLTQNATTNPKTLLNKSWTLVFTHQADAHAFLGTSLFPHISNHRSYAVLVLRGNSNAQDDTVLDFLGLWNTTRARRAGHAVKCSNWMSQLVNGTHGASVVMYTCDDWRKAWEYVEGYYAGLNQEVPAVKGRKKEVSFSDENVVEETKRINEKIDTGEYKGKVETVERVIPKTGGGGKNQDFLWGFIPRQTVTDIGIGLALFVLGVSVCVLYL
ncbi:hypothetical protein HDU81_003717 [Chytriomyces hyalinus]|nr:hypothetical protein HDU81_003717 [Chytriomyces hyalinus]